MHRHRHAYCICIFPPHWSRKTPQTRGHKSRTPPPHPLPFMSGTFITRKVLPSACSSTFVVRCVHTLSAFRAGSLRRAPQSIKTRVVYREKNSLAGRHSNQRPTAITASMHAFDCTTRATGLMNALHNMDAWYITWMHGRVEGFDRQVVGEVSRD